jgi:hypothetical protein
VDPLCSLWRLDGTPFLANYSFGTHGHSYLYSSVLSLLRVYVSCLISNPSIVVQPFPVECFLCVQHIWYPLSRCRVFETWSDGSQSILDMMPSSSEISNGNRDDAKNQKRKASAAEVGESAPPRPVKRRASKACQCCRARKVRCNVTEHGAPCTNCRLDEVDCIVSESRRKK